MNSSGNHVADDDFIQWKIDQQEKQIVNDLKKCEACLELVCESELEKTFLETLNGVYEACAECRRINNTERDTE